MPCWIPDCGTEPQVQWRRRFPDSSDTGPVFACGPHAISLDAAAHIHRADCAPSLALLPACGCTPEPLPVEVETADHTPLPTGWVVPASENA